jgi:processing peptidase subunit beta
MSRLLHSTTSTSPLLRTLLNNRRNPILATNNNKLLFSSSTTSNSINQSLLQAPATEVSKLTNGVRIASEGGYGETATVGVWIDAGSRDETPKNNGVAHFLEHMAFKGTSTRTQHQLEVLVENHGAHLNAYTSREHTVYYAKVFKQDVPMAMEILGDILLHASFEESAVNRERGVILREMEEVEKQQEEIIFDRLHETAYQGSGVGMSILGPRENINSITRNDLNSFIEKQYTGNRVVVAGAGAIDHKQLVELADKAFGKLAPGDKSVNPVFRVSDKARFTGSDLRIRDDSEELAHVAIAVESAPWTSPHAFPLMVMQTLLGCWDRTQQLSGTNMSSKLCQMVAEQSAASSVLSFNTCYKDTGLFGVYAVASPTRLNDLTWIIMESMVRLCHRVTEEEVARARNQLKATMISQLDGSSAVCEDIGRQFLTYGRRMTPAELFARIDAVDVSAVKEAANKYINDQDLAVAALGPIHELPDYNFIRRRSYHLRA